ncbi:MAG TPA: right-handed parallel beta-helix repeat-containing protein [bacterium]|nr:right-handed parallel beta-helix repeat-containing protein [bacterium]
MPIKKQWFFWVCIGLLAGIPPVPVATGQTPTMTPTPSAVPTYTVTPGFTATPTPGDQPTATPSCTPAMTGTPATPTPAEGCIYVPYQYQHIQVAIDAAQDGDTIYVAPDVYSGPANTDLKFNGKAVHLTAFPDMPTPVIDCQGTESNYHQGFIFNSQDGPDTRVSNLAVINGFYGLGGGMWFLPGSAPEIRNCLIRDCVAEWSGGGIQGFSTGVILNRVRVENCLSIDGGGAAACFQGGHDLLQPVMYRCRFIGNQCYNSNFGAVHIDTGSEPVITSCEFVDNMKHALWFNSGHGSFLDLNNSLFTQNNVGLIVQTGHAEIENCTFSGNYEYAVSAYADLARVDLYRTCIWGENDLAHNIASAHFCNMPDPTREGAEHCFHVNPIFVSGALGQFYVYQGVPNEPFSPNVNTGGAGVWLIQFPGPGYKVALENMTTSNIHAPDTRFSDIGYHYTLFDDEPTPQPPPERPVIEDILGCTEDFSHNAEMTFLVTVLMAEPEDGSTIRNVELFYENFPTGIQLMDDGTCGDAVAGDRRYSRRLTFVPFQLPDDGYDMFVVATDSDGDISVTMPYMLSVQNPGTRAGSDDAPHISESYVWCKPVTPGTGETGFLWILARVEHPMGREHVAEVRLEVDGTDTGLRLRDNGGPADLGESDGYYGVFIEYSGQDFQQAYSIMLDTVAIDMDGDRSNIWPVSWKTRSDID